MADVPPKRPRGRPALSTDGSKSVVLNMRVSAAEYDKAYQLAQRNRTSIPQVFRAAFRVALRQQRTLDEP